MNFEELEHFIKHKMRMSHIYQPLLIRKLLEQDNVATTEEIARGFLNNDMSELNYYKRVAKRYPRGILKTHGVISYEKDTFTLLLDGNITSEKRKRLIELCDWKFSEFVRKDPWIRKLRELDAKSISSSIRYDILAKAKGRCAACGIESFRTKFHIDHIIPRSLGGKTEPDNLQALCSQCNLGKRNRDDTDFIRWKKRMQFRRKDCLLCDPKRQIMSNTLACAVHDTYKDAMSSLIMPKRHVGKFYEMIPSERNLCFDLVHRVQGMIKNMDRSITGFHTGFDSDCSEHLCISVVPVR